MQNIIDTQNISMLDCQKCILYSIFQCSGDSGGPIYRWDVDKDKKEKRAILIGVVSRGTGCANFNRPGIVTRIKYHLKWIHEIIKKGNCASKNEKEDSTTYDNTDNC